MATAALFRLAEVSTEVFAVDAAGNSGDLGDDPSSAPPLLMPATVESMTGRGRSFGADIGMQAAEEVADSLRLTRDVTARAFVQYPISEAADGDIGTIVARGVRGSAAERLLFGVEIQRVDSATARLLARWEEVGGAAAPIVGATFIPDPNEFFAIAVARRWLSTTEVELLYVVNDLLIGRETVAAGDIGDGVGGTLTIGCAGDGAGGYERFLPEGTIIDQVAIETDAMCFEEIRQDVRRVTVHQPSGYEILRSYIPPGESWSREPDSAIQRWLASEGDGLGQVLALAAQLREDMLPDRAYGAALEHWEQLLGISPKRQETIENRRLAVIGGLRKILGFAPPDLQNALAPLFGLNAADVEIIEFGAVRSDDFSVDDISAPPSNMWRTFQGVGSVAVAAGACAVSVPAGTPNAQWYRDPTGAGEASYREASVRGELGADPDGACIVVDVDVTGGAFGEDSLSGLMMRNPAGDAVFFGISEGLGGAMSHTSFSIVGGVKSLLVTHATLVSGDDRLLLRSLGDGLFEVGTVTGGVVTILSSAVAGPTGVRWAGFGVFGLDAATEPTDAIFNDLQLFEPKSPRGFHFLAFRDPGLGGTYNIRKAQGQLDKQAPAHTIGIADDSLQSFRLGATGRLGHQMLMPRLP